MMATVAPRDLALRDLALRDLAPRDLAPVPVPYQTYSCPVHPMARVKTAPLGTYGCSMEPTPHLVTSLEDPRLRVLSFPQGTVVYQETKRIRDFVARALDGRLQVAPGKEASFRQALYGAPAQAGGPLPSPFLLGGQKGTTLYSWQRPYGREDVQATTSLPRKWRQEVRRALLGYSLSLEDGKWAAPQNPALPPDWGFHTPCD